MIEIGDQAPSFELPIGEGKLLNFPTGKPAVLYFYPKDDTPGCTTEAIEFTQQKPEFEKLGVEIFGMSPDTIAKHEKFTAKHELGISLVSDEDKSALEVIWRMGRKKHVRQNLYGCCKNDFPSRC